MKHLMDLEILTELDISYNRLTSFSLLVFAELAELTSLTMNHNQIKSIDLKAFENNGKLKSIQLNNNDIKATFASRENEIIESFDLSQNQLQDVSNLSFLINVKSLNLSFNHALFMTSLCCQNWMETLNTLSLDGIYQNYFIETISSLKPLKNLQFLNIGENNLSNISFKIFPKLENLKGLSLHKNLLTTLNINRLKTKFPNLTTIDLCDYQLGSSLCDIMRSFKGQNITVIKNSGHIECEEQEMTNIDKIHKMIKWNFYLDILWLAGFGLLTVDVIFLFLLSKRLSITAETL
jgi:Leucine-rich repeat (LRR) protein